MANRDFKIELDNVEMINGSDDLLKDTKVTKVTLTGENKLNSLNSTFENCTELTVIEGDVNLDGVSDMTEMTLNTPLDEVKVTNPTEETIQTDNSLNQVTNVKIGGTKYAKGGVQDVVGSLEWTAENFTYEDAILDNVYTNSSSIEESKNLTISNTLEQKATSIEITGQTYENLVNGKATKNLLDEMSMQQTEGSPTQFTPHMEQPICLEYIEGQTYQNLVDGKGEETLISEYSSVINDFIPNTFEPPQNQTICLESIEGETYQNLIKGKGEYKLTDSYSATCTESNKGIENPPSMIEIPEIWGNTFQGYANVVTAKMIVDSINNSTWTDGNSAELSSTDSKLYKTTVANSNGIDTNNISWIQLKANTTYSVTHYSTVYKTHFGAYVRYYENPSTVIDIGIGGSFTTDSSGKVFLYPVGYQGQWNWIRCVEGKVDLSNYNYDEMDLNYIQSVGDLYVDESGEPILDEEGNEQYKLDIISHGYTTDDANYRTIAQNLSLQTGFRNIVVPYGTPIRAYFQCIAKIDTTKAKTGCFCTFSQGGDYSINYNSTDHSLKLSQVGSEYFLGYVSHNEPFSITIKQSNDDKIIHVYFNGIEIINIASESMGFINTSFVAFNSQFHTQANGGCNYINILYAQCSKNIGSYVGVNEDDWNNINKWNKTTILMPQQLRAVYKQNVGKIYDKLYYDSLSGRYLIEKNIYTKEIKPLSCSEVTARESDTHKVFTFADNKGDISLDIRYNGIKYGLSNYGVVYECIGGWGSIPTTINDNRIYLHGEVTIVSINKEICSTTQEFVEYFNNNNFYYMLGLKSPQIIETKILEKPSLDAYSPKTYITTSTEVQPSQMSVTNKEVKFLPLSLQPSKSYTVQLDSIGKNNKAITVNLGGSTTTIQPTNDTSKHHRVSITTPSSLTTDNLDLSGEGVVVNDVMLFEGNTSEIKQDVDYMDGIQSIGEPFESRNLFDYTQSEVGLLDHTNGNISDDNSWKYTTEFIPVKPNTTYCISQTSGSVFNYKIVEYNSSKAYLKGTNWTDSVGTEINRAYNTFTTSANTYYLRLGWQSSIFEIQLEEDTFPTEFMAFDTVRYKLEIQTYDSRWDNI